MPVANTDYKIFLSGGASNSSNAASIGGAKSSQVLAGNLFPDITNAQGVAGRVVHRCVYIGNGHGSISMSAVRAWLASNTPGAGTTIDIGVGTAALNGAETAVANETTAPAGVTFSAAASSGAAVVLGNMAPGQFRALWLRLTVTAGTGQDPDEPFNIQLESESV